MLSGKKCLNQTLAIFLVNFHLDDTPWQVIFVCVGVGWPVQDSSKLTRFLTGFNLLLILVLMKLKG